MRIGYIYLYGDEWEEWKKHNPPLQEIIDDLKEIGCDEIYMDVFIEDYGFKEIERLNLKQMIDKLTSSPDDDQLIMRGSMKHITSEEEADAKLQQELKRLNQLHNRLI